MASSTILGYPRIGRRRELKTALESYWKGKIPESELLKTAGSLRQAHWALQKEAGIGDIPCNDFSLYDQMLDTSCHLGVVPSRYKWSGGRVDLPTYFALARGAQRQGIDVPAMEMSKWFDTNYHYIVPEFALGQTFKVSTSKPVDEFKTAKAAGVKARPVLIGPMTYLLLGKRPGGRNVALLDRLLPAYIESLKLLEQAGAEWVQLDEPALALDLDDAIRAAYANAYARIRAATNLKQFVTSYFGSLGDNAETALKLPVDALHIDLVRGAEQLDEVLAKTPVGLILSLGVVDGRNIWGNDLEKSLGMLERAAAKIGKNRIWVSASCSLLHTPSDLDLETALDPELKSWMAFAKQKLREVVTLTKGLNEGRDAIAVELANSTQALASRKSSPRIHDAAVVQRLAEQPLSGVGRKSRFDARRKLQHARLHLPLYPTTTIGSFPQTAEVRARRADARTGRITPAEYDAYLKAQVKSAIALQEEIGLDVLVHGEFERNDMVEYFGEVTILQWSFVRDDQPCSVTTHQIALALQDEVLDLEKAGIRIIQIDEPAFREGLPLRRKDWAEYLLWASRAFRLASTGVKDDTQIHTHMCYCEFNDIFDSIKDLDADVISIETSRSQMELLDAFMNSKYPNEIGPGVYDIHSPRVPGEGEMSALLEKAAQRLEPWQIWVNPDCGLKTRDWPETKAALEKMVAAAKAMRAKQVEKKAG